MVYVMRNGRRVIAALSFLLLCCGVHVHAQRVAVKTNALGWLTASPNVEAEFVLGSHVSLNMGIAANPISTDNFKTTFTHFQPEVRYWLNRPMVSHFLGITAFVNNFDMMVKDVHHKGDAYAAGLTYGYAWVLGDHWNIEATAGVGVLRYRQFKYDKGTPKPGAVNDSKTTIAHYLGRRQRQMCIRDSIRPTDPRAGAYHKPAGKKCSECKCVESGQ